MHTGTPHNGGDGSRNVVLRLLKFRSDMNVKFDHGLGFRGQAYTFIVLSDVPRMSFIPINTRPLAWSRWCYSILAIIGSIPMAGVHCSQARLGPAACCKLQRGSRLQTDLPFKGLFSSLSEICNVCHALPARPALNNRDAIWRGRAGANCQ